MTNAVLYTCLKISTIKLIQILLFNSDNKTKQLPVTQLLKFSDPENREPKTSKLSSLNVSYLV